MVTVTATDGDGQSQAIEVTITVVKVDEPPIIDRVYPRDKRTNPC